MQNLCKICDVYFEARRVNETLCSDECKKTHRHNIYRAAYKKGGYKKVKATKKICHICEKTFETTNNTQKCCGYDCSDENRRRMSRKINGDKSREEKKKKTKPIPKRFLVRGNISTHTKGSFMSYQA